MVSRGFVQRTLGGLWVVDGLLQLKPKMFTTAFISQVVEPTAKSEPPFIAHLVQFGAHLAGANTLVWDTLFALVQLVLGLSLLLNIRPRLWLVISVAWSLVVWGFGEGLGQIFTGHTLLLTGAPGAVLLYGIIALAVWPGHEPPSLSGDWRHSQIRFARTSLGLVWMLGCMLHFQRAYVTGTGISSLIEVPWLSDFVASHAAASGLLLSLLEFGLGLMLLVNANVRFTTWVSIAVSFVFWWVGQSFGQMFNPLATDVNSGPLLILLALAACPWLTDQPQQVEQYTGRSDTLSIGSG